LDLGYYGTAGFDSFVYREKNKIEKLAPVIEINARHSMSDIAHALRNRLEKNKFCFFRVMSSRRCTLPDTYRKWLDMIKEDHFNVSTQNGVILVSPIRVNRDGIHVQPQRCVFFMAAPSEKELFDMDTRLRIVLGGHSINGSSEN
jgi:hypothetical protein